MLSPVRTENKTDITVLVGEVSRRPERFCLSLERRLAFGSNPILDGSIAKRIMNVVDTAFEACDVTNQPKVQLR